MKKYFITFSFSIITLIVVGQSKIKILTSDIKNFWIAYDSIMTTKDTLKQIDFIQTLYLDKASDGLKDFMEARQHSAKRHLTNILKFPKFWTSVRSHTLYINSYTNDIEKIMYNFKILYPKFKQPEVYFMIGVLNSGGTTTSNKILIGSEIAASDSTVDASELNPWLQLVFKKNKNVIYLVAHEVGHTQQKEMNKENLLGYCLAEGACDFIAELLLNQPNTFPYMKYGKANEKNLWEAFQKQMYKNDLKSWLYNGGDRSDEYADLGYFIGYAICKSYYDKSIDKPKALKEIIEMDYSKKSVNNFLQKSGYTGRQK